MKFEIYVFASDRPEGFYTDAVKEYEKRLGPYCKISWTFIKKEKQWERLLSTLRGTTFCHITAGRADLSSVEFAAKVEEWEKGAGRKVVFLIGGKEKGENSMSLSSLIMPAGMTLMILYEQIYRAYRIINNQPYHK